MTKTIHSFILSDMVNNGHVVDRNKSLRVIYRMPNSLPYMF